MSEQLREWEGAFGEAYTERNKVDWRTRVPGFSEMLTGRKIATALEVGCNRGHNLLALKAVGIEAVGIEPNTHARYLANSAGLKVSPGDIYAVPEKDDAYDLVLCCGVLIHVPAARLQVAMGELARVARRYVLSIEYAAPEHIEVEVEYQGRPGMLWKRDYGTLWASTPGVTVVATGELGPTWDNATYWLMETT